MGGGAAVGQHGQKAAWLNVLGAHATKEERHITDLDRGQDEGRGPSSRGDMMKNIIFSPLHNKHAFKKKKKSFLLPESALPLFTT